MENLSASVEVFFRRFELNNNKNDFSAAVSQFADTFMAAGPQGAQCVRASDFALALPKRKQLFESFGCHSMQLIRVDAHSLGERYSMAYTRWKMNFAKGDLSTDQCLSIRLSLWKQPSNSLGSCFISPIRM